MKYTVLITKSYTYEHVVEADSFDEANKIAHELSEDSDTYDSDYIVYDELLSIDVLEGADE